MPALVIFIVFVGIFILTVAGRLGLDGGIKSRLGRTLSSSASLPVTAAGKTASLIAALAVTASLIAASLTITVSLGSSSVTILAVTISLEASSVLRSGILPSGGCFL